MNFKKTISLALVAMIAVMCASGCKKDPNEVAGKINIRVGMWPTDAQTEALELYNKAKDEFMEKYPDINIIPDTLGQDPQAFKMKAAAGQLPNLFKPWLTEFNQIVSDGYAADITDIAKDYGYYEAMNPDLMDLVKGADGKLYALPTEVSVQGLYLNKKLFREAGLVNADGSMMVPDSYEEIAEFAKIIKDKTGQAGVLVATNNNVGGWLFLNIAWSYGVEFLVQNDDGTWKATFDTPEMREALQYIKDLKWKYDVLLDDTVIDQLGMYQYFGTYQGAIMIANPPCSYLTAQYEMNIDDIFVTKMPEGPKGRYSQIGANIWMFSSESTPEQIDACMKWLEFMYAYSVNISDEQIANLEATYADLIANNGIITDQDPFDIWVKPALLEKTRAARAKYTNVKHENYEQYYGFEDVIIKPEPAVCAQEMYAIIDRCIQEVITNENADIDSLVKTACNDFQVNHLDKLH